MKQSMLRWGRTLTALLLLTLAAGELFAQKKITIKLASPVPQNTPWGASLDRMAAEWSRISNGEVTLQIYHNGVAGSEADVLRKVKQNQIQAAILTSLGLGGVVQEIMTLSAPFLIRTDAELDAAFGLVRDQLEAKLSANGFMVMTWAKAGWVRYFSKKPVLVPSDLHKMKLGTDPDQTAIMQALKAMGYQCVPLVITETMSALSSGLVDAIYQSPLVTGAFQVFALAKNMTSFSAAPFMGALLINQRAWRTIPEQYRPALLEVTQKLGAELDASISQLEADAITTMKSYGLVINTPEAAQMQLWYDESERIIPSLLGTAFDRDIYNRILALLKERR